MSVMFKTIFSGSLEFGNQRSYDQVLKLFLHRTENYYRNDILLKAEEVFQEDSYSIIIPRYIKDCPEKSWKNTLNLLEYMAGYAIAGDLKAWIILNGTLVEQRVIEPSGDKTATQAFLQGRKLVTVQGKETEAVQALNRAIEKFERHALAYERRGYVNFRLRNYDDALYDFTKSIDINPNLPDAYWGRANAKIKLQDTLGAISDLEQTIAKSIPHQPIYWSARRLKGELHLQLGEFQKAIFELKLVTNRTFGENDPNSKWQKNALYNYGRALFETGHYAESVSIFNKIMNLEAAKVESPSKADALLGRAMARKMAGEIGFDSDLREAANLGSAKALELLGTL